MYRFLSSIHASTHSSLLIAMLLFSACQTAPPTADGSAATLTAIPAAPALDNGPAAAIKTTPTNLAPPTLAATAQPTPSPTPSPTPTPSFPAFTGSQPIDRHMIGIQVHPYGEDQEAIMGNLTALGVGWVKIQVSWKLFQPGPDRLDEFWFSEAERLINMANDQDIKVLIGIAKAPEWSRPTTDEDGPPTDLTNFTNFTALLAERWAGKVDAWEIWNESNLRREWNGAPLSGAEFTQLVKAGADGIRMVDQTAVLISGAPAPTGINDGINAIDDRVYFEQMLAAGIAQHVDGIGYHPYSGSNPVWGDMQNTADYVTSHNDHPSFFFSHTTSDYLALMEQYAVDQPLWGTEFGWGSYENLGKSAPVGVEYMDQINEWQQAENVVDVFIFANESEKIGPMFVWNLNFAPLLGPDFAEAGYGILRPDGSKRPVWYALQNMPKQ